jgi:hypothetical protein
MAEEREMNAKPWFGYISNPLGRLPTEDEARAQLEPFNIRIAAFEPREQRVGGYPRVRVLTENGWLIEIDMWHGGGTLWTMV